LAWSRARRKIPCIHSVLLGVAAAWSTARAQQPERMRRIGVLMAVSQNDPKYQADVVVSARNFRNSADGQY
jgi:hypothetical protein